MSFSNLKRGSSNLDKLKQAVESLSTTEKNNQADNFWKPEVDKLGNGYAVIRFLPASEKDGDDSLPWVKMFSHGFQGPGGWYIENSLTTLNQKDPVSEYNSQLWNSGVESNKKIAQNQKRKLSYIANVYIVEDPKHPENNGKVFLYKFGKIIFDKISGAMNPEFADEKPINPFDLWNGANFKLKIRKVDGYQNYDKCEFDSQSPLSNDDEELEKIWKTEYSLKELVDPNNPKIFKDYDYLKSRLNKILGLDGQVVARTTVEDVAEAPRKPTKAFTVTAPSVEEEDDDMSYFTKLAAEE